ncbi:hypothetical protein HDV00_002404 [Rhizophlyctis rosea]|nr:hypothetical protein HDV00_002404 [Rhizophlyctis rosea]
MYNALQAIEPGETVTPLKQYGYAFALIFWSAGEMGDIILFYERFKIVHTTAIEKWFLFIFFGSFTLAVGTRSVDIYFAGKLGVLHDMKDSTFVWLIEPTYLMFLLICEVLLQWRYTKSVLRFAKGANVAKKALLLTLLRSAGARFLMILLPMLARGIISYVHKDQNDPSRVMSVAFNTSVNLFTMVDLLMLKYELLNQSRNKSASRNVSSQMTWDGEGSVTMPSFTHNSATQSGIRGEWGPDGKGGYGYGGAGEQQGYAMVPVRKFSGGRQVTVMEGWAAPYPTGERGRTPIPPTPGQESMGSGAPLYDAPTWDRQDKTGTARDI